MKHPDRIFETYLSNCCTTIEISIPCDDPYLDGDIIKDSMNRIRSKSIPESCYFEEVFEIKKRFPLLEIEIMAYSKAVSRIGIRKFCSMLYEAKIDFVLVPDATIEFLGQLEQELAVWQTTKLIYFAKFDLSEEQVRYLRNAKGYIFQQSNKGKTGARADLSPVLENNIKRLRNSGIKIPIVVGFGISDYSQVRDAEKCGADGVVIGSSIFKYLSDEAALNRYLSQFQEFFCSGN